jgi:hypothetical protein
MLDDERRERLANLIAPFRVEPGSKVVLHKDFDPDFDARIKKQSGGADDGRRQELHDIRT